ncbi:MAG: hypothetical protein NTX82_06450 [Candidatus Parcubacteria bacterium]|nr:hypothetical protein [Candidatus Parcubacteria bacterium]
MAQASLGKTIALLLIDEIRNFLYFPLWWYSKGYIKVLKGGFGMIRDFDQTLGFSIWLKNLFVPMFGQTDFAGRVISFLLRIFQIIFKGIALLLIIILILAFFVFWLVLPLIIIYMLGISFGNLT